jgi:tetratricopeptide (TPR) repeat protein
MNSRRKLQISAAQQLLRKIIATDPRSAPAFGLSSFVATLGVHLGWSSRSEIQPIAFRAAQRAIQLNDEDPWGHIALGYATLQIGNHPEEAIAILENALRLNPHLATAHYFIALASCYANDPNRAFRHADLAEQLGSHDLLARGNVGAHDTVRATACFVAGRYPEGMAFARRALVQSPRQTPAFRQLVTNGSLAGETAQAAAALQTILRLAPGVQRWLKESETIWSHAENYKKYIEAFRAAGFK